MHEKKRPDEKSEDPVDAREFKHARDNMGDYKLKTAKDYVVPKAQRITTDKKRKELLLLRHRVSVGWNETFNNYVIVCLLLLLLFCCCRFWILRRTIMTSCSLCEIKSYRSLKRYIIRVQLKSEFLPSCVPIRCTFV